MVVHLFTVGWRLGLILAALLFTVFVTLYTYPPKEIKEKIHRFHKK